MRKSLLVFAAASIALSGMAATPRQQQRHASSGLSFDKSIELKSRCDRKAPSRKALKNALKKAPSKLNSPEDIIASAEGQRQDMTVTASGYYLYAGMWLAQYANQKFASHVIYGENNDVYIYDVVPALSTESYVKGRIEDGKIIVDLPQTVLWDDDYEDGVNVNICEYFYDEEYDEETYVPIEGASLIFSVAEDGSLTMEDLGEDNLLALNYCSDDMWAGYGASELTMAPFDGVVVTVPDDIEVSKDFWKYKCDYLGYGWPVSFAQGGEEVYFQGLSEVMPEAWVKASVEYGSSEAAILIDQNQYVGTYGGLYVYTKAAQIVVDEEYGWEFYELMPDDYKIELIWDYEEETIRLKDPTITLLFNASLDEVDYVDEMFEFELLMQDSYEGTPANPTDLKFNDLMSEGYDYNVFEYRLPAFSTDGDVLDVSCLSYVVYIDGEEWTFEPEDYDIEEAMVEIPWTFDSDWIMKWPYSTRHGIGVFAEGITSLGVQSIYRYEGEETRSEIVTIDLDDPSAVGSIAACKKVAEVKYYGIDGREVAKPATGIFVKRVTFDDGSVATFKKAIR